MAARITDPVPFRGRGTGPEGAPLDDGLLLARAGAGDAAAFRTLLDRNLGIVVATARRVLGDEAEAQDVAQEAMLRLWRAAGSLQLGDGGVRPWLRRVATNLSIDRIRAGRREVVTDEVPEQPVAATQQDGLDAHDVATRVTAALGGLPERQRLAITLFHYEGLSQVDVGKALGVSDEAVESLLARARRTLKAALKDDWRDLVLDD